MTLFSSVELLIDELSWINWTDIFRAALQQNLNLSLVWWSLHHLFCYFPVYLCKAILKQSVLYKGDVTLILLSLQSWWCCWSGGLAQIALCTPIRPQWISSVKSTSSSSSTTTMRLISCVAGQFVRDTAYWGWVPTSSEDSRMKWEVVKGGVSFEVE